MSNIYNKIRNILLLNVKDTLIKQKSIYLDDDVAEMDILDDSFFEDESYLNHDYNIKKFLDEFSDPCDIIKYRDPKKVKNFIDKMAIWWEFKYSNNSIDELFGSDSYFSRTLSSNRNNSFSEIFSFIKSESCDCDVTNYFYESLSDEEKKYCDCNRYVFLECSFNTYFYISSDGIIQSVDSINKNTEMAKLPEEYFEPFMGKHINDIKEISKKTGVYVSDKTIDMAIKTYNDDVCFREGLLNSVMYKLIERGGSKYGAKRAFMLAMKLGGSLDIPMKYGVDYTDYNLREYINMYLKAGGSTDLVCYVNYSDSKDSDLKKDTVKVSELVKGLWNSDDSKYTPEECRLHQRLVNVLSNHTSEDGIYVNVKKR